MKEQEAAVAGCSEGNFDLNKKKKLYYKHGLALEQVPQESLVWDIFKNEWDEQEIMLQHCNKSMWKILWMSGPQEANKP